jgi:flavodoxin
MKTLVVYYTITGNTQQVAAEVASALDADIEVLKDPRIKPGLPGYLRLAHDTIRKVESQLAPLAHDPASYDLVVLAGPVWSSKMCSPIRVYARQYKDVIRRAAFLCTSRSSEPGYAEKCVATLMEASGITPVAILGLGHREVREDHSTAVAQFVAALNNSERTTAQKGEKP